MKKELLKGLTEDQIRKVKACKNTNELLSIAKDEGVSLTDEQLEAINGGCSTCERKCPMCGSTEFETKIIKKSMDMAYSQTGYKCKKCHHYWVED